MNKLWLNDKLISAKEYIEIKQFTYSFQTVMEFQAHPLFS